MRHTWCQCHVSLRVFARSSAPATDRDLDCWDLKDGACSPRTVKSGETLVDARGDTDVQIVRYALKHVITHMWAIQG